MGATKKSLRIVFAVAIVSLLMKVPGFAQEQIRELSLEVKTLYLKGKTLCIRFFFSYEPEGWGLSGDGRKYRP